MLRKFAKKLVTKCQKLFTANRTLAIFSKRPRPNPGLSRPASNEDGALLNVLPAFDRILSTLEEARKTYTANKNLAKSIDLAWNKMKDYYKKTDIAKVYLVASVLDPRIKLRYFEINWKP